MIIQDIKTGRFKPSPNHADPKDHEKELADLWFAKLDSDAKLLDAEKNLSDTEKEVADLWYEILKGAD